VLSQQKNALEFKQEFAGSTENVIASVLRGKADAGATFVSELDKKPGDLRRSIRTILATPEIAPHPLGAHPRVPPSQREGVRRAVLAIAAEAEGARLLAAVKLAVPVAADYGRDYRPLEQVDITGLAGWGK
jgi:phosphonate transport system substrate-binding protein